MGRRRRPKQIRADETEALPAYLLDRTKPDSEGTGGGPAGAGFAGAATDFLMDLEFIGRHEHGLVV